MKSIKSAISAREEGNTCYRKREFNKALDGYNKSIRYSCFLTDSYIKALGNKSALQFERRRYVDCQNIINFIFSLRRLDHDEGFVEKLNTRMKSCSEKLKSNSPTHKASQPSQTSYVNSNILVVNSENGRSVVSKSNISPNDTIYRIEPYTCVLASDKWTDYCYKCFKYIRECVIVPCDSCVYVQYCSTPCRDDNVIHDKLECPRMEHFVNFGIFHLAVRVLVKLKPRSVQQLFDATENKNQKIENEIEDVDDAEIISLYHNDNLRSHMFQENTVVMDKAVEIIQLSYRFSVVQSSTIKRSLETLACQMILNASTISHCHTSQLTPIGSGIYPKVALLNHSCYPNTCCLYDGNIITVKAIRTIPTSATVFNTYGVHFEHHNKGERQKVLYSQYSFQCRCECCEGDWCRDNTTRHVKCKSCARHTTVGLTSSTCVSCSTSLAGVLKDLQVFEELYNVAYASFRENKLCECFEMLTGSELEKLLNIVMLPDTLLLDWNDLIMKCIMAAHESGSGIS